MESKAIIDAYCRIRTIDNTIPDEVLDYMKEASLSHAALIRDYQLMKEALYIIANGVDYPVAVAKDTLKQITL